MVDITQLGWGDYVYAIEHLTPQDIFDSDTYDETILMAGGTKGRVVATPNKECVIVFFEPDVVLYLYPQAVTKDPIPDTSIYKCPVCGTFNSLEELQDGCKECGVPSDPGTGVIGNDDDQAEEV